MDFWITVIHLTVTLLTFNVVLLHSLYYYFGSTSALKRACDRQLWFCTLRCYRNQAGRIKAFFTCWWLAPPRALLVRLSSSTRP